MIKARENVTPGETPAEITVSMIQKDLENGISKPEMVIKYGIKAWEVDEMFKHPDLKGRRPARKRVLSFKFVDDTEENMPLDAIKAALPEADEVDPNQITLEDAIDEAIETVEEVKDQMQETQDAIVEMLSPTEFETPEETLLKAVQDTSREEEELEMDDDTFEL